MTADDPGENIGNVGQRVNMIQLAGFDQGGDDSPVLGTAVRTCEQCVFPVERDRTNRTFHDIVVELDTAIVDEARQTSQRERP